MEEPELQQELSCAIAAEAEVMALATTSALSKKLSIGIPIEEASSLVGVINRNGLGINLKKKKKKGRC